MKELAESEFYMWRAVFAFAFVDNTLSLEEQDVLKSYANNVKFSDRQLAIIKDDFKAPPSVVEMHKKITQGKDRERFCILARLLAWCEGDMDRQEATILKKVSCIAENDIHMSELKKSRDFAHDYYKNYARAGVIGVTRAPHNVEMRA